MPYIACLDESGEWNKHVHVLKCVKLVRRSFYSRRMREIRSIENKGNRFKLEVSSAFETNLLCNFVHHLNIPITLPYVSFLSYLRLCAEHKENWKRKNDKSSILERSASQYQRRHAFERIWRQNPTQMR